MKKKPMLKSSPTKTTTKQRQTHVQKFKIKKTLSTYGKLFCVKKDKLVNQNQTGVPNAPLTYGEEGMCR